MQRTRQRYPARQKKLPLQPPNLRSREPPHNCIIGTLDGIYGTFWTEFDDLKDYRRFQNWIGPKIKEIAAELLVDKQVVVYG